jgi:hypothetical protein
MEHQALSVIAGRDANESATLEDSLAVSYKPIQTFTICSSDYAS